VSGLQYQQLLCWGTYEDIWCFENIWWVHWDAAVKDASWRIENRERGSGVAAQWSNVSFL
jgi:hypothetical protein